MKRSRFYCFLQIIHSDISRRRTFSVAALSERRKDGGPRPPLQCRMSLTYVAWYKIRTPFSVLLFPHSKGCICKFRTEPLIFNMKKAWKVGDCIPSVYS